MLAKLPSKAVRPLHKREAVIIGDRLEADIVGATTFGIDSCWFNPGRKVNASSVTPTYEEKSLRDLPDVFAGPKDAHR